MRWARQSVTGTVKLSRFSMAAHAIYYALTQDICTGTALYFHSTKVFPDKNHAINNYFTNRTGIVLDDGKKNPEWVPSSWQIRLNLGLRTGPWLKKKKYQRNYTMPCPQLTQKKTLERQDSKQN